jgi:hypothetical protein
MCIICLKPHGIEDFTDTILKYCWDRNNDGAGFAYYKGEGIWSVEKGFMKYDEFMNAYRAHSFGKDHTSIIHFRKATSGLTDEGNTHPFIVTDDKDKMRETQYESSMIAFHNGVVGKGDKKYSDSMEFVSDVLFPISPLWEDKRIHGYIAEELLTKNSSRWLVCAGKTYHFFGTWHKHNGWEFSNSNYEPLPTCGNAYTSWPANSNKNDKTKDYSGYDYWLGKARGYGLPKGNVWSYGMKDGNTGFWMHSKFTSWKEWCETCEAADKTERGSLHQKNIEERRKPSQLPPLKTDVDFNMLFMTLATTHKGKSNKCIDWLSWMEYFKVYRKNYFLIKEVEKEIAEAEEPSTIYKDSEKFNGLHCNESGDLIIRDEEADKELEHALRMYGMCPECTENISIVESPYSSAPDMCSNCGCVFNLKTGTISHFDHMIHTMYLEKKTKPGKESIN